MNPNRPHFLVWICLAPLLQVIPHWPGEAFTNHSTHLGFPAVNLKPPIWHLLGKKQKFMSTSILLRNYELLFEDGKQGLEGVYWRPNSFLQSTSWGSGKASGLPAYTDRALLYISLCLQTRGGSLNYCTISRKGGGMSGYSMPLHTSSSQLLQSNQTFTWTTN